MRILVLLNPTNKKGTKAAYTEFWIMRLTEKQFCKMGLYQEEKDYQESIVSIPQKWEIFESALKSKSLTAFD